jgi:glycosyltransferase involved in cell wall biosynthesis
MGGQTDPIFVFNASHLNVAAPSGLNSYSQGLIHNILRHPNIQYLASPDCGHALRRTKAPISSPRFASTPKKFANWLRFGWYQTALPPLLTYKQADVFYSPLPEGMLFPVCKQIITIADLIAFKHPDALPAQKHYFQYVVPRLISGSKAVVAISQSTKRDVEQYYSRYNKPVYVVYPCYDKSIFKPFHSLEVLAIKAKFGLTDFLLCVGELRPYKNARGLIEAFGHTQSNCDLVFVGKVNRLDPEITMFPGKFGLEHRVKFLQGVSNADLALLYNAATALVFPSKYEGFGIPSLEAMACGCPVVSSNATSLPEVTGECAIYFDPDNLHEMTRAIQTILDDASLRERLSRCGLEQAKCFSYDSSGNKVLEICQHVFVSTR